MGRALTEPAPVYRLQGRVGTGGGDLFAKRAETAKDVRRRDVLRQVRFEQSHCARDERRVATVDDGALDEGRVHCAYAGCGPYMGGWESVSGHGRRCVLALLARCPRAAGVAFAPLPVVPWFTVSGLDRKLRKSATGPAPGSSAAVLARTVCVTSSVITDESGILRDPIETRPPSVSLCLRRRLWQGDRSEAVTRLVSKRAFDAVSVRCERREKEGREKGKGRRKGRGRQGRGRSVRVRAHGPSPYARLGGSPPQQRDNGQRWFLRKNGRDSAATSELR